MEIILQPVCLFLLLYWLLFYYLQHQFQLYCILIIEMMLSFKALNTITKSFRFSYLLSTGKHSKPFTWKTEDHKSNKQSKNKEKIPAKTISQNKDASSKEAMSKIDFTKYSKQVQEILTQKKQLRDLDLAFLAQKVEFQELEITNDLKQILKKQIKMLKNVDFALLPPLLNLAFSIGIFNPPQMFVKTYLQYFKINTFSMQEHQALNFPQFFLKKVAFQILIICSQKNFNQFAIAFRRFGGILSQNQLKKIDQLCCQKMTSMSTDDIVKFLNIFRQIQAKGNFVDISVDYLIDKKDQLGPKSLIMTCISLLQLGNSEGYDKIQAIIQAKIQNGVMLGGQIVSILHILHKYKVGRLGIWKLLEKRIENQFDKLPFEHLFALMSGLNRHYLFKENMLVQLVQYEPTLKYAQKLEEKQFIEFFFVLFSYYSKASSKIKQAFCPVIIDAIKSVPTKSVYNEIKQFFLFLFENDLIAKKQYLKKSYPSDSLISLVSHIFSFENCDIRESQQYQKEILQRYKAQDWKQHKDIIVAEEFIRYKLSSFNQEKLSKK